MDPTKVDGFKERYEAGYCGFMTWNTDAIFANPTVDGTTILENVKGQSMTTRTSYELAKLGGNNRRFPTQDRLLRVFRRHPPPGGRLRLPDVRRGDHTSTPIWAPARHYQGILRRGTLPGGDAGNAT